MKECKNCNIELEDEHCFCPKCGQPLSEKVSVIESLETPKKKEEDKPKIPLTGSEASVVKKKRLLGICLGWYLSLLQVFHSFLFGMS